MEGYSPKIPFVKDPINGFSVNKTAVESIRQDFKMLILTNPGERMMNPDYGVGIKRLLFEQKNNSSFQALSGIIQKQVKKYMDFLKIDNIQITDIENSDISIYIKIEYSIPSINLKDQLDIALSTN